MLTGWEGEAPAEPAGFAFLRRDTHAQPRRTCRRRRHGFARRGPLAGRRRRVRAAGRRARGPFAAGAGRTRPGVAELPRARSVARGAARHTVGVGPGEDGPGEPGPPAGL